MYITSDMDNLPGSMNKELSEDRKELIGILLAFVVMAGILWLMLISASVPCNRSGQWIVDGDAVHDTVFM